MLMSILDIALADSVSLLVGLAASGLLTNAKLFWFEYVKSKCSSLLNHLFSFPHTEIQSALILYTHCLTVHIPNLFLFILL